MSMLRETSLPWEGLERGHLDEVGAVTRTCSTDYLVALYTAYVEALENDDTRGSQPSRTHLSLQPIIEELRRLARYPSLFPTDVARNRFLALLEHSIEHQVSEFDEERRRFDKKYLLQQANLIAKKEDEILEATNRPTFKSNLLPWEQFLLKGSPGSGIDLPQSLPNVNPLVMPIAGVALHLNWLRNKQIAVEKCGNTSLASMPWAEKPIAPVAAASVPSSGLEYKTSWISITPNIYFARRLPMMKEKNETDKLENFNTVVELLEGDPYTNYNTNPDGVRAMFYRCVNKNLGKK